MHTGSSFNAYQIDLSASITYYTRKYNFKCIVISYVFSFVDNSKSKDFQIMICYLKGFSPRKNLC